MRIERLSAIAEIVSSIAIVVTLIYLAIQTTQNTAAVESGNRQQALESEFNTMLALSDNTEALIADLQGTEISRADNMRLIFALSQFFRTRQHLWLQYKNGVLDEETWATYQLSNSGLWRLPAVRRTWGLERDNLAPDFVAEVDDMLASMEVLNPRERLEP